MIINEPKINMHNVKALLIYDYMIDEAYPSVGIMDEPVDLLVDSDDKIELKGKIQTSLDISNIKYKLYWIIEKQKVNDFINNAKDNINKFSDELKTKAEDLKSQAENKYNEYKSQAETKMEDLKDKAEEKIEEVKTEFQNQ